MRYLVIVQLGQATVSHVSNLVPSLQAELGAMSKEPVELAFRSATADLFGFFVDTDLAPQQIRARIESPGGVSSLTSKMPILEGNDALLIIQLGAEADSTKGFTRALTWLQRH